MSRQHACSRRRDRARSSSRPRGWRRLGKVLADVAIGHQPHEIGDRRVGKRQGRDAAAVAHDRDAIADAEHLVEPMGDVDNGDAARGESLDQREQLIDLARRQRRRRLVHHEHRRRRVLERLRDLDQLPLREAETIERRALASISIPRSRSSAARPFVKATPVDDAERRASAPSPRKMFSATVRRGTRFSSW